MPQTSGIRKLDTVEDFNGVLEYLTTWASASTDESRETARKAVSDKLSSQPDKDPWESFDEAVEKATICRSEKDRFKLLSFVEKHIRPHVELLRQIQNDQTLHSLRDFAKMYDTAKFEKYLASEKRYLASDIRNKLLWAEPLGTIEGMVQMNKICQELSSAGRASLLGLLAKLDSEDVLSTDFTTSSTKVVELLSQIAEDHRSQVQEAINRLIRLRSLAPSPRAMQALSKLSITSAYEISQYPREDFIATTASAVGGATSAMQIHDHACKLAYRNQQISSRIREFADPGLNIISMYGQDATAKAPSRVHYIEAQLEAYGVKVTMEDLFGPMEQSLVDESQTVYSPTSYFVDLLAYLSKTSIKKDELTGGPSRGGQVVSFKGTVLERLLRRRPDLLHLQLTSQNTNKILPYIDLVNEVMESFIVNLPEYWKASPREAKIEAYNVDDEDSDDLLAQPQNVKKEAYRALAASVYPTNLPYHQPLDLQRVFLKFLGVSRLELVRTFRPKALDLDEKALAAHQHQLRTEAKSREHMKSVEEDDGLLVKYQDRALDRQQWSEVLGLCQEEFLIWTKEVFWQKEHFALTEGPRSLTEEQYRRRVGLREPFRSWGYESEAQMMNGGVSSVKFVKKQLLPRAGIDFTDLVEIVQTKFVNPYYPSGRDNAILKHIGSSYRHLQTLVDVLGSRKYDLVVQKLAKDKNLLDLLQKLQDTREVSSSKGIAAAEEIQRARSIAVIQRWVEKHFANVGKLIILEDGQGPTLLVTGYLYAELVDAAASLYPELDRSKMASFESAELTWEGNERKYKSAIVGQVFIDGTITANGKKVATIDIDGSIRYVDANRTNLIDKFPGLQFSIRDAPRYDKDLWTIIGGTLKKIGAANDFENAIWQETKSLGDGNIDNVHLVHIDGSALTIEEWDRLNRFMRVWRKLGWSVPDTDRALSCLSAPVSTGGGQRDSSLPGNERHSHFHERFIKFHDFVDETPGDERSNDDNDKTPSLISDLDSTMVEQLAAIKEILNLTSLSVEQLLTFWSDMSCNGPKSQFERLFGRRSVRGKDETFKPDKDGNYFTTSPSNLNLLKHRLTIAAALGLRNSDLDYLVVEDTTSLDPSNTKVQNDLEKPISTPKDVNLGIPNRLNMSNLSKIYAYSLLAKVLSVEITDLRQIMQGFGRPFDRPSACLSFIQKWNTMQNASFSWPQLRYIVDDIDSRQDPLDLTPTDALKASKQLRDNVLDIQITYPAEVKDKKLPEALEYVKHVTSLLLEASIVQRIISLLTGTTVYSTWAPKVEDDKFARYVEECSKKTITYLKIGKQRSGNKAANTATLQVTGILTQDETDALKSVINKVNIPSKDDARFRKEWNDAVHRITVQQPHELLYDTLVGIVPPSVIQAEISTSPMNKVLLAPDMALENPKVNQQVIHVNEVNEGLDMSVDDTTPQNHITNGGFMVNGVHSPSKVSSQRPVKWSVATSAPQTNGINGFLDEHEVISGQDNDARPRMERSQLEKIGYFLQHYTPYLHKRLTYDIVVETIASVAGFKDVDVARTLLESVISSPLTSQNLAGPRASTESALDFVIKSVNDNVNSWQGYLKIDRDDVYTFVVEQDQKPDKIILTGVGFSDQLSGSLFTNTVIGDQFDHQSDYHSNSGSKSKMQKVVLDFVPENGTLRSYTATVKLLRDYVYALRMPKLLQSRLKRKIGDSSPIEIPTRWFTPWWKGYLCPSTSDIYSFTIVRRLPTNSAEQKQHEGRNQPSLVLNSKRRVLTEMLSEDDTKTWTTEAFDSLGEDENQDATQKLNASTLYTLALTNVWPDDEILWKVGGNPKTKIPATSLLPDIAPTQMYAIFSKMRKIALFLNHLPLTSPEITFINTHAVEFTGEDERNARGDMRGPKLNLDGIHSIDECVKVYEYVTLRSGLPKNTRRSLMELFYWASERTDEPSTNPETSASDIDELATQICLATNWPRHQVASMLNESNDASRGAKDFRNPRVLSRFAKMMSVSTKLDVSISTLFEWACPLGTSTSEYHEYHEISQNIQQVVKSRYNDDAWPKAVRPLNNTLRENQKTALISYLMAQEKFVKENNIIDVDGLFDYFLIDVQMTPLVETSRIVQATSTVQLFIQRCFLGLERDISSDTLSANRWKWMSKYRVWEANRKVFLYPENWIEPTLRDNKTEIFEELESELLQKNLTDQTLNSILKKYVYNMATVSNLVAIALYIDNEREAGNDKVHIFARTRTMPCTYYHNTYNPKPNNSGFWTGWRNMQIEIPYIADTAEAHSGNFVAPTVFQGRLILFIGEAVRRVVNRENTNVFSAAREKSIVTENYVPEKRWEFRMSWTELRDGRWIARQSCPTAFPDPGLVENVGSFCLFTRKVILKDGVPRAHVYVSATTKEATTKKATTQEATTKEATTKEATTQEPSTKEASTENKTEFFAGWVFDGLQISALSKPELPNKPSDEIKTSRLFGVETKDDKVDKLRSLQAKNVVWDAKLNQESEKLKKESEDHNPESEKPKQENEKLDQITAFPEVELEDTSSYIKTSHIDDANSPRVATGTVGPFVNLGIPYGNFRFYNSLITTLMTASSRDDSFAKMFDHLSKVGLDNNGKINKINDVLEEAFGAFKTNMPVLVSEPDHITFNERRTLYSLYHWELGLHVPMILIDRLFKGQQYEEALKICHLVFDPLATGGDDTRRFWKFAPFKSVVRDNIERFFRSLKAGKEEQTITEWREDPFQPYVVARGRPQAYMKWVVKTYIKILIAWGDSLFKQNTLESIPQAIQLYVLASHIYGPRGYKVPRQKTIEPQTFYSLSKQWDDFSNAMIQLEQAFPFSRQSPFDVPDSGSGVEVIPTIFGSASTLFFAIPDNPDLRALATTIDDRLFKIRNSQDINGQFRKLPLFAPPIDPALLVQATAQGLSLGSVLQDLQGPLPNCKFQMILSKAFELIAETKILGQSLLSIRERKDAEMLANIRQRHELSLQTAVMSMKQLALDEANHTVEQLEVVRKGAVSKLMHFFSLVGGEMSGIPEVDREFQELDAKVEKPLSAGGLGLSPMENEQLNRLNEVQILSATQLATTGLATIFHPLGQMSVNASPLGIGGSVGLGLSYLANGLDAASRVIGIGENLASHRGSMAGLKASHQRALQDRVLQANAAGHEVASINKQIIGAKIRIAMASRELELQQKQIDQAREVSDFLREKYSTAELYSWMDGVVKGLYHQIYTEAFALARKAELAFKYERPHKLKKPYIQPGYFDSSRDGLLAGESLYRDLKRLESAYLEEGAHDYEVTKSVSLRMLNPVELIKLRETGSCSIKLDEMLFDMDFPGHYLRRIKNVNLTIPCVVGSYTSINATLTLTSSEYRISDSTVPSYSQTASDGAAQDERFSSVSAPISSIAVCAAQNESGVFALDFSDSSTRYLPFEGAGAISTWELKLPKVRQFDYSTIFDVVMQLRYTSVRGSDDFGNKASDTVGQYFERANQFASSSGLTAIFDIKNENATAWSQAVFRSSSLSSSSEAQTIELGNLAERLPFFARQPVSKPEIKKIRLLVDRDLSPTLPSILIGKSRASVATKLGEPIQSIKQYETDKVDKPFEGPWAVQIPFDPNKLITKCVMVVEYTTKKEVAIGN